MAIKMLVFDVRECEREIFENEEFQNFEIKLFSECLNDESIKKLTKEDLDNAMAISVFLDSEVTENVINSFKNLRIISTRSSSIEHINKKAAQNKNIDIVNVEGYSARTAAQFTIGLMIALVRNIIPLSKFIEKRETVDYTGFDISKLTIGVIGTGATGAEVCKITQGLGMRTLAYDVVKKQELLNKTDAEYVDFETILTRSDIVTIHLPYSMENKNLITAKEINMMKNSAYLINISRSEIVNMQDLYQAIKDCRLRGAALDIRTCDSVNSKCLQYSRKANIRLNCYEETKIVTELSKFPNVIITPQVAYKTADVMEYILKTSIKGVLDCIKGGFSYRAC